jgi:hypothetical protein
MTQFLNPIAVRCPYAACDAREGQPCVTVGGYVQAAPHTRRLRLALGKHFSNELWARARTEYCAFALSLIIGRPAEAHEIERAQRDGTIRPGKQGWVKDLVDERAPRRSLPSKRLESNGRLTLWGVVVHEVQLPSGSFILELDSGEVVKLEHNEGWPWAEWWPERKREAAQFLNGKTPRYRFSTQHGQCYSVDFEEALPGTKKTPASTPAVPSDPAQGSFL